MLSKVKIIFLINSGENTYHEYSPIGAGRFDAYQLSIFGTVIPTITYYLKF
jgi:hypothetical protein